MWGEPLLEGRVPIRGETLALGFSDALIFGSRMNCMLCCVCRVVPDCVLFFTPPVGPSFRAVGRLGFFLLVFVVLIVMVFMVVIVVVVVVEDNAGCG